MRILFAACTAIALASSAQAITVINGSFENGINPAGSTYVATGDATSITGWTVLAQGVDYVDSSIWDAARGSRSVDLSGLTSGGILQTVAGFTIGKIYRVRVDVSANPFDPLPRPRGKQLLISTSQNTPLNSTYILTSANSPNNMLYETVEYQFTANRTSMPIRLQSRENNAFGVVIDNVRVSAVPEMSTWILLCGGMGMIGLSLRRRDANVAVAA
jgi:choice-of-anchor C domain-containing protein